MYLLISLPFSLPLSLFTPLHIFWSPRSLELFFATSQGPWGNELQNNKSPRLSRKFSTPPPLSIPSQTSSPMHCRKLSLSSPVSGGKVMALDLSASSTAVSSPTSTYNPMVTSPPHNCTKAPLDLSKGPSSPELGPTTPEEGGDLPRVDAFCGKLRKSVRKSKSCKKLYVHLSRVTFASKNKVIRFIV